MIQCYNKLNIYKNKTFKDLQSKNIKIKNEQTCGLMLAFRSTISEISMSLLLIILLIMLA